MDPGLGPHGSWSEAFTHGFGFSLKSTKSLVDWTKSKQMM